MIFAEEEYQKDYGVAWSSTDQRAIEQLAADIASRSLRFAHLTNE
jgi:hypothetical protein